jgi:Domain of unknown function (DUF4136)
MRLSKFAAAAVLGIAAIGLSACAESLNTQVTRYQAMPAPQGQSFVVVPGDGMAANGGLEFQRYASVVAQQLAARGYTPATSPQSANMIVQLGYRVSGGQVRYTSSPYGYDPFFGGGRFFYPRFGRFGFGSPFYYGWDDPFGYGGGDGYVEYHSEANLHIRAAGTNQPLFDGRAQARSETNRLDVLVPDLVQALFTGFPGQSGETVRITIPTRMPAGHSAY